MLGLRERLPAGFLDTLDEDDLTICYRAAVMCYGVTGSAQVPREMQLKAVLSDYHGKDTLVSAGTGSGKTLPIALNVLLDDPDNRLVTVMLSPLKRLQVTQESDFNTRYGISTVVINEDTPREDAWWTENVWNYKRRTLGQARLLIVTVEQLFKSREGHLPRLAILLRNQSFQRHIVRVVVDEAHNIHTAGLSHYGLDAFRPAWGRLDELKAILPRAVRWAFLSATFPPHIRATVEKLLRPGYTSIHTTSNRPNTIYATHEVINSIEDLQNYECFLSCPFALESQPRVLIFVDKKELACRIADHLDSCLPSDYRDKGIVRHYHSMMSQKYLQVAHKAFTTPSGNCRILVATSGQSVGVDFPDVKVVCTAGLPGTLVDILQRGGCALRNSDEDAILIVFYEPWVHEVSMDEYNDGNLRDPDRPRALLKPSSQRRERAPFSCLKLVKSTTCLRAEFAAYLDDTSPAALAHTTTVCCTATGCDGPRFSIQDLLPGKLAVAPSPSSTIQKPRRTHNTYRPTQERPFLEFRLTEWLKLEYLADPFRSIRPPEHILSETQRVTLVRADPRKIKSAQDITVLVEESAEWEAEWSAKIFEVITLFDKEYACISGQLTTNRKRKRVAP
ncbi:P-loop containing nucleoside triphosphate hydrolase protein [Lactarius psammicola]|nr:P-loop containing nucleoside triphosphate hydrolase protein [Lactarius psammicola]